nr:MAG TPA: hypothetical protein [Crassvirales sp.]
MTLNIALLALSNTSRLDLASIRASSSLIISFNKISYISFIIFINNIRYKIMINIVIFILVIIIFVVLLRIRFILLILSIYIIVANTIININNNLINNFLYYFGYIDMLSIFVAMIIKLIIILIF